MTRSPLYSRRSMLGLAAGTGVALATGSSAVFAQGATPDGGVDGTHPLHLINSFMTRDWRGNFDNLDNGAILVDVDGRTYRECGVQDLHDAARIADQLLRFEYALGQVTGDLSKKPS